MLMHTASQAQGSFSARAVPGLGLLSYAYDAQLSGVSLQVYMQPPCMPCTPYITPYNPQP